MFNINNTSTTARTLTSTTNPWPFEPMDPKQGLILFVITLPGTLANIIAFLVTIKLLQTHWVAPNFLVLGLTLTDFYGIVFSTLPTLLCYLHKDWYGGQPMCNFQGVSSMFAPLASGFLATSMAVDRLLAVWKPFIYRRAVTVNKTLLTIGLSWIVSLIVALVPLTGVGRFKRNLTGTFCTIDWFAKTTQNVVYSLFFSLLGITLVFGVVFCNIKVVCTLVQIRRHRSKALSGHGAFENGVKKKSKTKSTSDEMELQFAKTVGVISLLFVICWLPFMVRIMLNLAGWWTDPWADVQVSRLLVFNFVLDPFLYTLSRKQCRDILKEWFCCLCSIRRKRAITSKRKAGKSGSLASSSLQDVSRITNNTKSGSLTSSSLQDVSKTMKNTESSSLTSVVVACNKAMGYESNQVGENVITANPVKHGQLSDSSGVEYIPLVSNGKSVSQSEPETEPRQDDHEPYEFNNDVFTRTFSLQEHGTQSKEEPGEVNRAVSVPNLVDEHKHGLNSTEVNIGRLYDLSFRRTGSLEVTL